MTDPLYIDTLSTSDIQRIEARLRPGQYSSSGFLGHGESLRDVVYGDAETLQRLGVTHAQIADKLESLIENPYTDPSLEVRIAEYRGMQEDPFQNGFKPGRHSNLNVMVKNRKDNTSIGFPGLIVTLIRDYQFFEGNVNYRLDPERAVAVLGLK